MQNKIRDNYDPHPGDYHNAVVTDTVRDKVWWFFCDGTFRDMSRIDITVVNEAGDSKIFAISQGFVTGEIARLDQLILDNDLNSKIRDKELEELIYQKESELDLKITQVETDAITRETDIRNALEAHIKALDQSVDNLTKTTSHLAELINIINRTAVFDVTLDQKDTIALQIVDGQTTESFVFREATATQNGLMPAEAYQQLTDNTDAIQRLQNAGLYRGSFDVLDDAPTHTPDERFIHGEAYNNDFITVQEAEYEGETGIAHYRIMVDGEKVTYYFESFVDKDIMNFAEGEPGLVVGGTEDGELGAQPDGTGKVNGWDAEISRNNDQDANIASLTDRMSVAEGNITDAIAGLQSAEGDIDGLQEEVAAAKELANQASAAAESAAAGTDSLTGKPVNNGEETTLGANSAPLLTAAGMMSHWVDVTETGMPDSPDPNTFYYTVV